MEIFIFTLLDNDRWTVETSLPHPDSFYYKIMIIFLQPFIILLNLFGVQETNKLQLYVEILLIDIKDT